MEVHFTSEQEAKLAQLANQAGTNPESLVREAALQLLQREIPVRPDTGDLPIMRLGTMKSLHRRNIYHDFR